MAEAAGGINEHNGRTVAEEFSLANLGKLFAEKHRQYVDGVKIAETQTSQIDGDVSSP